MINIKKMKENNRDYHSRESSCAQAFLEKIGVLQLMEYARVTTKNRSPQTAVLLGMQEVIKDDKLRQETNVLLDKTGFSRNGFETYDLSLRAKKSEAKASRPR